MEIKQEENYYSTSNLNLATVINLHFPIDSLDRTNPKQVEFMFERSKELDQLIESYWKEELKLEPKKLFKKKKELMSRINQ
jgi:hypothetical protein